jgi:uncharacterized protein DUF6544
MAWPRAARIGGAVAGGVLAAGVAATAVGSYIWHRGVARREGGLVQRMRMSREIAERPFQQSDLAELPPPVARYFAFAIPDGRRRIRAARVRWAGDMRLQPGAKWSPFTADQRFTVSPPGFVWDARVRMMPMVPVRVRDSYVAGEGEMLGRIGGVVSVLHEGGTREMALSALVRWLGEAAWFPTALLPGKGVTWQPVADSTARATVTDGDISVSGEFRFAPTGEMTRMTAMRYRNVKGTGVATPFEGRYDGFERRQGVMVPKSAEVAWLLPAGRFAYWRGRPTNLAYEFAMAPTLGFNISSSPSGLSAARADRSSRR